jgi:predicted MPP superfamily phosphohydrolase
MIGALLLLLGACVGHTIVMVFTMNWLYGCPFPKWVMKPVRPLYALLILIVCLYFGWTLYEYDFDWWRLLADSYRPLSAYIGICWAAAFVMCPLTTTYNWLIRNPPLLLSNHTSTLDMTKELGFKPAGHGKRGFLARLPFNECFQVDFAERYLKLPQIPPEWDGLKILHLSDLHFCGTPERSFYHRVIDQCRAWDPDIVAITGDFVDTDYHHRWIVPILGRLRWKIAAFAILGNHDAWREAPLVRRRLRRIGFQVLESKCGVRSAECGVQSKMQSAAYEVPDAEKCNSLTSHSALRTSHSSSHSALRTPHFSSYSALCISGHPMIVIGHEGPWFDPPDLSDCPAEGFRLCLSHTPDNLAWAKRHRIDLMLAGHVHGGQIRLPLLGSIFVPSKYSRRYDGGTFHEAPTVLHVSRGLAGEVPLRYNCRPEVTLVVLRT